MSTMILLVNCTATIAKILQYIFSTLVLFISLTFKYMCNSQWVLDWWSTFKGKVSMGASVTHFY